MGKGKKSNYQHGMERALLETTVSSIANVPYHATKSAKIVGGQGKELDDAGEKGLHFKTSHIHLKVADRDVDRNVVHGGG